MNRCMSHDGENKKRRRKTGWDDTTPLPSATASKPMPSPGPSFLPPPKQYVPMQWGFHRRAANQGERAEVMRFAAIRAQHVEHAGREEFVRSGHMPRGPPDMPTGAMVIEQKYVAFLIGPSGRNISAINNACCVSVHIDQSTRSQLYSIANIYGSIEGAEKAKLMISQKLATYLPPSQRTLSQELHTKQVNASISVPDRHNVENHVFLHATKRRELKELEWVDNVRDKNATIVTNMIENTEMPHHQNVKERDGAYLQRKLIESHRREEAMQCVPLVASSCQDVALNGIIPGTYQPFDKHHGKVVYKRDGKVIYQNSWVRVFVYFWADLHCPALSGWRFGPEVGGDVIWAFHPDLDSMAPPIYDWRVPRDKDIDPSFTVTNANQLVNLTALAAKKKSSKAKSDTHGELGELAKSHFQQGRPEQNFEFHKQRCEQQRPQTQEPQMLSTGLECIRLDRFGKHVQVRAKEAQYELPSMQNMFATPNLDRPNQSDFISKPMFDGPFEQLRVAGFEDGAGFRRQDHGADMQDKQVQHGDGVVLQGESEVHERRQAKASDDLNQSKSELKRFLNFPLTDEQRKKRESEREEGERQQRKEERRRKDELRRQKEGEFQRELDEQRRDLEKKRIERECLRIEESKSFAIQLEVHHAEEARRCAEAQRMLQQNQSTLSVLQAVFSLTAIESSNFRSVMAGYEHVLKAQLPHTGRYQGILAIEVHKLSECLRQVEFVRREIQSLPNVTSSAFQVCLEPALPS